MGYIQEREMEDVLRHARRQLQSELAQLPQGDQRRERGEERIRENAIQIRQIANRHMDVCSDLECVEEGRVTKNGKQWCKFHS
jgi:hypothetical protein